MISQTRFIEGPPQVWISVWPFYFCYSYAPFCLFLFLSRVSTLFINSERERLRQIWKKSRVRSDIRAAIEGRKIRDLSLLGKKKEKWSDERAEWRNIDRGESLNHTNWFGCFVRSISRLSAFSIHSFSLYTSLELKLVLTWIFFFFFYLIWFWISILYFFFSFFSILVLYFQ